MTRPVYAPPLLLAALLLVGCGSAGSRPAPTNSPAPTVSPSPSPAPSPTQPPVTDVRLAAQAAALVFASQDISRMAPLQTDAVGQSAWYEASADATGFVVTITAGAGDCQAGCIEQHVWRYHVDHDGTVTLLAEEGDDIGLPSASGTADPVSVQIALNAGPVCPVERDPPDPACAPRPVVNVDVFIYDAALNEVGRVTTDATGRAALELPPGAYVVAPSMVPDLMGQAEAQAFAAVGGDSVGLVFSYDTGIR